MRVIKIKPITEATGRCDDDENSLYEDLYCSKYDCSYMELMENGHVLKKQLSCAL